MCQKRRRRNQPERSRFIFIFFRLFFLYRIHHPPLLLIARRWIRIRGFTSGCSGSHQQQEQSHGARSSWPVQRLRDLPFDARQRYRHRQHACPHRPEDCGDESSQRRVQPQAFLCLCEWLNIVAPGALYSVHGMVARRGWFCPLTAGRACTTDSRTWIVKALRRRCFAVMLEA